MSNSLEDLERPLTFKCCVNKEFSNFICIACTAVYHPSCLNRRSYFKSLGNYRIYCSKRCESKGLEEVNKLREMEQLEEKYDLLKKELDEQQNIHEQIFIDNESTIKQLELTVKHLNNELKSKEKFIQQQRRSSTSFQEDVLEAEQKFDVEIKEKRECILILNKKISTMDEENKKLSGQLTDEKEQTRMLKEEIEKLNQVTVEMISSIRTLEKDNDWYQSELQKLRQIRNPPESSTTVQAPSHILRKPSKILIIGDDNARGCLSITRRYTNNVYDINCQHENGIRFEQQVQRCIPLCKYFKESDYIF